MAHIVAFSRMIRALRSAWCANLKAAGKTLVVTGAGLTGLNAAYQLKKAGIRADVYEAGARVGGRVLTHTGLVGKGLTIELGAEFINTDHLDMYLGARPDVTLYLSNRRR